MKLASEGRKKFRWDLKETSNFTGSTKQKLWWWLIQTEPLDSRKKVRWGRKLLRFHSLRQMRYGYPLKCRPLLDSIIRNIKFLANSWRHSDKVRSTKTDYCNITVTLIEELSMKSRNIQKPTYSRKWNEFYLQHKHTQNKMRLCYLHHSFPNSPKFICFGFIIHYGVLMRMFYFSKFKVYLDC